MSAWLLLIAAASWWVLDETSSGWPIIVTILAAFGLLYQVNEAWTVRDLTGKQNADSCADAPGRCTCIAARD